MHTRIAWSGGQWEIRDLGSRNGTFVNGALLEPAATILLQQGDVIGFGGDAEVWELTDDSPPQVRLVPLSGGDPLGLEDGSIEIPDSEAPVACIHATESGWALEYEGDVRPIEDDEVVVIEGEGMRFEAPAVLAPTPLAGGHPCKLGTISLELTPPAEPGGLAKLHIVGPTGTRELPDRACHVLALRLAEQRLADEAAGVADPGWLTIDEVQQRVPGYTTPLRLNLDVHRLRKQLTAANVIDAAGIVERKTGRIRLGIGRCKIVDVAET